MKTKWEAIRRTILFSTQLQVCQNDQHETYVSLMCICSSWKGIDRNLKLSYKVTSTLDP
ncbi:unnamed protein product [Nezara viridula]|uniref:Uncharacterized protein n=1 Tax=Nezara viridula TaxID=85310 RepID=A0A9P0HM95_NEZVI|nr:unnamed protein product [Nezara viridula]